MLNLDREITPEDFARDPDRTFCGPDGRQQFNDYVLGLKEIEAAFLAQESRKAAAHHKAEQSFKNAIPYSESIAVELCKRVAGGEFLIHICKEPDTPLMNNVVVWLKEYSTFKALYDEAVNDRLLVFEEQLLAIADDAENDFRMVKKAGKMVKQIDPEVITRSKLRCEMRRAHLI
jgi:hypothetical protein